MATARNTTQTRARVSTPRPAPHTARPRTPKTKGVAPEAPSTHDTAQAEMSADQFAELVRQLTAQQGGSTPATPRAASGEVFKLDSQQLAGILTSRGRRAMQSVYHDDFATAIANPGTYYGIRIEPPLKAAWIISQIRKAAREHGLNSRQYSTYNRESEGFISYVVHHVTAGDQPRPQ